VIAVDTSALMAIALREPQAESCAAALDAEADLVISAATMAEALIVALGRNVARGMSRLFEELDFEVVPVTSATARRVQTIYRKWGKGIHSASLNLGDCFAYDVAREHDCRLLYIGNDFSQTDIASVL
jgi:ribonuclease VapC